MGFQGGHNQQAPQQTPGDQPMQGTPNWPQQTSAIGVNQMNGNGLIPNQQMLAMQQNNQIPPQQNQGMQQQQQQQQPQQQLQQVRQPNQLIQLCPQFMMRIATMSVEQLKASNVNENIINFVQSKREYLLREVQKHQIVLQQQPNNGQGSQQHVLLQHPLHPGTCMQHQQQEQEHQHQQRLSQLPLILLQSSRLVPNQGPAPVSLLQQAMAPGMGQSIQNNPALIQYLQSVQKPTQDTMKESIMEVARFREEFRNRSAYLTPFSARLDH
jgi:hypothetical protein